MFELIKQHNLYDEIYQKIVPLIQLDSDQAIAMLLERNKIPSKVVIEQLQNCEEYLYMVGPYLLFATIFVNFAQFCVCVLIFNVLPSTVFGCL